MKRLLSLFVLVLIIFSCTGANLLFKDGFEGNTRIYDYVSGNQWWAQIVGVSDTANWVWPTNLPFKILIGNQYQLWYKNPIAPTLIIASTPQEYVQTFFDITTGRLGTPSRVIHCKGYKETYPRVYNSSIPLDLEDLGTVRTNWVAEPDSSIANWQLYESFWIKFNSNLDEMMAVNTNYKWFDLWEVKTYPAPCPADPFNFDTRLAIGFTYSDEDGAPFNPTIWWTASKETLDVSDCSGPGNFVWQTFHKNTTTVNMVFGDWIKVETFLKQRNDGTGRFWARVNGFVIADVAGPTHHTGYKVSKWNMFKNYMKPEIHEANRPYPVEIWVDDLEFWDDIP